MSFVILKRSHKALYGLVALPLALSALPLFVYLPKYYLSATSLSLSVIGICLLLIRLVDFVSDPLVGYIDDRFSRFRHFRSVFMFFGAVLAAYGSYQLLLPKHTVSPLIFICNGVCAFLGWSVLSISYHAWGAELSENYKERTEIVAFRELFGIFGTVIALSLPLILYGVRGDTQFESDQLDRRLMEFYAWIVAVITPFFTLIVVTSVPASTVVQRQNISNRLRCLFFQPGFTRLLCAFFVNGVANALPATLFLFYGEFVLTSSEKLLYICLALYFFAAMIGLPCWVSWSNRLGKVRLWRLSILVSVLVFGAAFFLRHGDIVYFSLVCILTGFCLGADLALPASIQADVISERHRRTGAGSSGITFGLWGMAYKFSLVMAVAVAFPLLDAAGFVSDSSDQSDAVDLMLRVLYCLFPIVLKVIVWWILRKMPDCLSETRDLSARKPQEKFGNAKKVSDNGQVGHNHYAVDGLQ